MTLILIRKALLGILYLFIVSFIAFFMSLQMPGDPAEIIANQNRSKAAIWPNWRKLSGRLSLNRRSQRANGNCPASKRT